MFIPVTDVASGQLSVNKETFRDSDGIYGQNLETPAAEEFEPSCRLGRLGIPILFAPHIIGVHDTEPNLEALCVQHMPS